MNVFGHRAFRIIHVFFDQIFQRIGRDILRTKAHNQDQAKDRPSNDWYEGCGEGELKNEIEFDFFVSREQRTYPAHGDRSEREKLFRSVKWREDDQNSSLYTKRKRTEFSIKLQRRIPSPLSINMDQSENEMISYFFLTSRLTSWSKRNL